MEIRKVNILGMELEQWTNKSCVANIAVNDKDKWATVYDIGSREQGRGHATELLKEAKNHYEKIGYKFGGSVALNERMRRIYKRVGVREYR